MIPAWKQLGKQYEKNADVIIAEVDCTDGANHEIMERFDVKGYPTLMIFNGASRELGEVYNGERGYDALSIFVEDNKGPSV
jgi:thiol-disulfide isomerase/thioredoxin